MNPHCTDFKSVASANWATVPCSCIIDDTSTESKRQSIDSRSSLSTQSVLKLPHSIALNLLVLSYAPIPFSVFKASDIKLDKLIYLGLS